MHFCSPSSILLLLKDSRVFSALSVGEFFLNQWPGNMNVYLLCKHSHWFIDWWWWCFQVCLAPIVKENKAKNGYKSLFCFFSVAVIVNEIHRQSMNDETKIKTFFYKMQLNIIRSFIQTIIFIETIELTVFFVEVKQSINRKSINPLKNTNTQVEWIE